LYGGDKMNNVIDVINHRTSLRKYDKREISKEHLDIILQSAMRHLPQEI
jgi:nitroreductase